MLAEAHVVKVELPAPHLVALAAVRQRVDQDGRRRDRVDQRGRLRYDHLYIRAAQPPPISVEAASPLSERDLRWLVEATLPRRGERAEQLAVLAVSSGLFRALYDLDLDDGTARLGKFKHLEPRPEARPALQHWLRECDAADVLGIERLAEVMPPGLSEWVKAECPRILANAAPTQAARSRLISELCTVGAALPTDGVHLSVLAGTTIGRTHGLDPSAPLGRIAVRMAAAIADLPPPANSTDRRAAWEAVGVWTDPLSSQVMGWRLPLNPAHPASDVATAYDAAGQPAVLTIGLLAAAPVPVIAAPPPGGGTLWVVEGVSVLAAIADRAVNAAVCCRSGTPSVAVMRLVAAAAEAGWRVLVSSDFEPGGLKGAVAVLRQAGSAGQPWRLTASEYQSGDADGEPYPGSQVPATPWAPDLAVAMRRRRERVSEESRLEALLADIHNSTPR